MTNDRNDILLAGAGRTDITPSEDCLLDGFAARDHGCEGIHDNLTVTTLALSRYGKKAVIIGMDMLGLTDDQMERIWERAHKRFGLKPDQLLINCSHTHACPMIRPRYNSKFCPENGVCLPDTDYIDSLIENILKAIDTALGMMKPAQITWELGKTHIGIYRRAQDISIYSGKSAGYQGIFANIPNPEKEIDRTCPVFLVTDDKEQPIALLFGASCHPTTMSHDNYLVSAEYPGVAKRILEENLDGAPALFLQGMGGDVKPRQVALEKSFRSGDYDDVEAVGKELADDVKKTLVKNLKPLQVSIKSSLKRVPLPLAEGWNEEIYYHIANENESEYRRIWAKFWLEKIKNGDNIPKTMDITLCILELSPELRFLGIAGELLTDMGLKLKHHFKRGIMLPLGYTNGRIGYIPDSVVQQEGGYEPVETIFFTNGMPAPFSNELETILISAFDDLTGELK